MLAHKLTCSLRAAIDAGLKRFDSENQSSVAEAVYTFIQNRVARMLVEEGFDKDLVAAVVSASIDNIPDVWQRTAAVQTLKRDADFEPLAAAFKRVVNILRKAGGMVSALPEKNLFQQPSETALHAAYQEVKSQVELMMAQGDLEGALRVIATLRAPVDKFFEDVMVMTDDEALRNNRLALLQAIAGLFDRMADFSKIAT